MRHAINIIVGLGPDFVLAAGIICIGVPYGLGVMAWRWWKDERPARPRRKRSDDSGAPHTRCDCSACASWRREMFG